MEISARNKMNGKITDIKLVELWLVLKSKLKNLVKLQL